MKKIVILGCENSHANSFLNFIRDEDKYKDVEVVGVYSHEREAAEKLSEAYGVKVMDDYAEEVGKVDGVIITARHGDNHYKYAKPYIASGVPMFVDKPITVSEDEAVEFMRLCQQYGVRVTGGSCLKHADAIQKIKEENATDDGGKTFGGFLRAPISLKNVHGGFFFYSQHLAEMVMEAFGAYPKNVQAFRNENVINVVFGYDDYDICAMYVDGSNTYYASRHAANKITSEQVIVDNACFLAEFNEFYELLLGAEQKTTYKDFISPVFVLNAIYRSLESGAKEAVKEYEL